MKKAFLVLTIIFFIGVGGFVVVEAMNQGKSAAEQSSFTREFIDGNSKTKDGFFLFTSKTRKYTLLFPEDYQLEKDNGLYEISKNDFEVWAANSYTSNKDFRKYLQVTFSEKDGVPEDQYKYSLEHYIFNDKIDKKDLSDKIIYIAGSNKEFGKIGRETRDPKKFGLNQIGAFIKDKNSKKYIEVDYSTYCYKKDSVSCHVSNKQEMNFINKFAESIHFSKK